MARSRQDKKVSVPLGRGKSSGMLHLPAEGPVHGGIVIAHGAGNDRDFPLIVLLAREAAKSRWAALRFNFLYREEGRKSPDRQEVLEEAWKSALALMRSSLEVGGKPLVGAGKSLGGRVMSQLVSRGVLPLDGLVFLGYPLHAPGKKAQPRDAHLYGIGLPMLFFAGTRDSLCDLPTLGGVIGGDGSRCRARSCRRRGPLLPRTEVGGGGRGGGRLANCGKDPRLARQEIPPTMMNTCKYCKWWRVSLAEAQPTNYGQCMHAPPQVFVHYDDETNEASMFYERPQTYEDDYCARFESKGGK